MAQRSNPPSMQEARIAVHHVIRGHMCDRVKVMCGHDCLFWCAVWPEMALWWWRWFSKNPPAQKQAAVTSPTTGQYEAVSPVHATTTLTPVPKRKCVLLKVSAFARHKINVFQEWQGKRLMLQRQHPNVRIVHHLLRLLGAHALGASMIWTSAMYHINSRKWTQNRFLMNLKSGSTLISWSIIKGVQACFLVWFTSVAKEQLLSIQTLEDAKSRDILLEKAPWWSSVFACFSFLYRLETRTSRENTTMKRRTRAESKKLGPGDLGSPTPSSGRSVMTIEVDSPGTCQESYLITKIWELDQGHTQSTVRSNPSTTGHRVSDASIAAPDEDSGGGPTIYAARENECDAFANSFCSELIQILWRNDGLDIEWIKGRRFLPKLIWRKALNSPLSKLHT